MTIEMTIKFEEQEILDMCRAKVESMPMAVPGTWELQFGNAYGYRKEVTAEFVPSSEGHAVDLAA